MERESYEEHIENDEKVSRISFTRKIQRESEEKV